MSLAKHDMDTLVSRITEAKVKMSKVGDSLKNRFVGIDHIIDSILQNMMVWYAMPELVGRPTIINRRN